MELEFDKIVVSAHARLFLLWERYENYEWLLNNYDITKEKFHILITYKKENEEQITARIARFHVYQWTEITQKFTKNSSFQHVVIAQ